MFIEYHCYKYMCVCDPCLVFIMVHSSQFKGLMDRRTDGRCKQVTASVNVAQAHLQVGVVQENSLLSGQQYNQLQTKNWSKGKCWLEKPQKNGGRQEDSRPNPLALPININIKEHIFQSRESWVGTVRTKEMCWSSKSLVGCCNMF